ncbi:MAG: 2,5-dihydroxypyridine 5,6-dioxygenase [Alphaproteobacteria bacterium]|jgi:2,5-dihydroxypyridine 5,6-dioxygenase
MRVPAAVRHQEMNPAKLPGLFLKQFVLSKVSQGETMVLLSDMTTRPEYVEAAFAAAEDLGANAYELRVNMVPSWTKVGIDTIGRTKGVKDALIAADIVVALHIPLFTSWLREVMSTGTRFLMIIDAPDDLETLLAPKGLKEAVKHAHDRLAATKEIRVVSDAGTDLTYSCGEYPVMSQWGYSDEPGHFDHWGVGHTHTFPNEGSANGTVVMSPGDIVILPYCRYVHDEVRLEIRDGFIRNIEGGLDAKLMTDWLDDNKVSDDDLDPYAVSHLGWGMNPQARWYNIALNGDDPERAHAAARVFPGNFLFSTGPNTQGGGTRNTKGHYDVPMRDCSVILDNDVIIDKGRIVDEAMIVEREAR